MSLRGPHWGDRADVLTWLALLREVIRDLSAAAEDVTRPEDDRTLGRLAARETILAAIQMLNEMLDLAMSSPTESKARGLPN